VSAALTVLLLLAGVHHADVGAVSRAVLADRNPVVSREVVAAIIEHESHGDPTLCRDDRGGSSRGLMQVWHPDSACEVAVDEARFASDYSPGTNVARALRLLHRQKEYHLKHCVHPHDFLEHFAGTGPSAKRFARDVRKRARAMLRR
jgi:hypothetical protein